MSLRTLKAEPYPIQIELAQAALVIIDMQNDFCSEGGWAHVAGLDIGRTASIIPRIKKVLTTTRQVGMLIIHTREGHRPDLSDCPKNKQRKMLHTGFEYGQKGPKGRFFIRGTWNNEIVEPLEPMSGRSLLISQAKVRSMPRILRLFYV